MAACIPILITAIEWKQLEGCVFKGKYLGLKQIKDFPRSRPVFKILDESCNNPILRKFRGLKVKADQTQRIWRGFSLNRDYYPRENNADDDGVWIFAPLSCAIDDGDKHREMFFRITQCVSFKFETPSLLRDYSIGFNNIVEPYEVRESVFHMYRRLFHKSFFGWYLGIRGNHAEFYVAKVDNNDEILDVLQEIHKYARDNRKLELDVGVKMDERGCIFILCPKTCALRRSQEQVALFFHVSSFKLFDGQNRLSERHSTGLAVEIIVKED